MPASASLGLKTSPLFPVFIYASIYFITYIYFKHLYWGTKKIESWPLVWLWSILTKMHSLQGLSSFSKGQTSPFLIRSVCHRVVLWEWIHFVNEVLFLSLKVPCIEITRTVPEPMTWSQSLDFVLYKLDMSRKREMCCFLLCCPCLWDTAGSCSYCTRVRPCMYACVFCYHLY